MLSTEKGEEFCCGRFRIYGGRKNVSNLYFTASSAVRYPDILSFGFENLTLFVLLFGDRVRTNFRKRSLNNPHPKQMDLLSREAVLGGR